MSLRRPSVLSVGSRLTVGLIDEEPHYEDLSDEELRQTLEQTIQLNRTLSLENDIFERYLTRHDPQSLQTMCQVLESAKHAQRVASQIVPIASVLSLTGSMAGPPSLGRGGASPSISSTQTFTGSRRHIAGSQIPRGFRISIPQRIEMANKEIEEMKKSLCDLEQFAVRTRASLRAQQEEVELRIRETYEARAELEENVVKKGVDPLTGKIPAEKFLRFMDEWLKAADSIIEKLRLKSATLKSQVKKAKQQLIQKEELGETLHAIDFEQLAIENQDYVRKIEEKNRYLLEMKRITGRRSLELTNQKARLGEQMNYLKTIKSKVGMKENQIEKLEAEQQFTMSESEKAGQQLLALMQLMDEYTVPEVLDFVKLQAEVTEMRKTYKRLDRHRKIQQDAIRSCKKQMQQVTGSKTINKSWLKKEEKSPKVLEQ